MSDYRTRKAERTRRHEAQKGLKMVICSACSGSGIYDNTGSPPCGACGGTGKVREEPPTPPTPPEVVAARKREQLQNRPALQRLRRSLGLR
ncbi:unnamed protein product [Sphagnum tenellum]